MLDDPRAERFIAHFTDEWLDLRDLEATTPDATLYPDFSSALLDAMRAETRAFVTELVRGDEPVTALVRSDFVMVNQRLASHYFPGDGAGVRGCAIRRVPLPEGSHRGGLLGQAAIHKVTANGTVTSPVKRGVWVLRELLDAPPDPPPPGVPAVDPDVRGAVSIRDQLARHTSDAGCAGCHAAIDPPGFALERFDAVGQWRDRYRVFTDAPGPSAIDGPTVDDACTLADGRHCASFEAFRDALVADRRLLAAALARQLVVYATGADVLPAERDAIARIVDDAERAGGGVRAVIHAVVASPLFLDQ